MENKKQTPAKANETDNVTLWRSVVEDVKSHIDRNVLAPGDRLPSINELCAQYGVGANTIRTALKELAVEGYVKSRPRSGVFVQARQPANSKLQGEKVLAIIVPRANHLFLGDIVQGAEAECRAAGYNLLIANTEHDPRADAAHLERLASQVAGLLVVPANPYSNQPLYNSLAERGVHHVFIDRYVENTPAPVVATDNAESGYLITRHLLEHGQGPLFVLCSYSLQFISSQKERLVGYRRALQESGIAFDPSKVLTSPLLDDGAGIVLMRELLQIRGLRPPFRIFALDECVARGAYIVLKEASLRIPEDVVVAGIDDTFAVFLDPPLTTIRQDLYKMGSLAAQQVIRAIENGRMPTKIPRLKPELVIRNSSTDDATPVWDQYSAVANAFSVSPASMSIAQDSKGVER